MMTRSLTTIAWEIEQNWNATSKNGVNYAAKPYLDAMKTLHSVDDSYGEDSGKHIVLYFLSNASSYRGEVAKAHKAELKAML
jgi:hypothetical protein